MRAPKRALSASPAAIVPDEPIAETNAAGRPAPERLDRLGRGRAVTL